MPAFYRPAAQANRYSTSAACQTAGITLIIVHHTKRMAQGRDAKEPLELTDLAFSGFAEWARQWLLLSRREALEAIARKLVEKEVIEGVELNHLLKSFPALSANGTPSEQDLPLGHGNRRG